MTSFWSLWVILLTGITIAGLTWVLFANRTRGPGNGEQTTGHECDGIEELDNPLPAWWFAMFVITIVWGVAYLIAYPGLGNFPGLLGWTQIGQYEARVAAADERFRDMRDRYLALPIEEIATNPEVRKMGMRMFATECAQCHGADARGSYGFPNLADDDWIHGGTPSDIKTTISKGRQAAMPAWGEVIGEEGVANVTAYVLSLNGREADAAQVDAGARVFQSYCIACHGADGSGNPAMGAPNLGNGIWLYGGTPEQISHSIRGGRNGAMPAFADTLSEDKIHILAAYVYGLNQ